MTNPWSEVKVIVGDNDNVKKYVFTNDTAVAESVLYKYPTYKDRTVICCSTQSGCPVGCRFCGAGDNFVRSLTTEEIVSQSVRLLADTGTEDISSIERLQIMFMSMGEPMLNQKALIPALYKLYELYPNAKLLVSTSGPKVDYENFIEVAKDIPAIGLQFSVHESTDEARDKLIPFKVKLTLEEIACRGEDFFSETGRKPFFNYCAHAENTLFDDARRLHVLFDPSVWEATISVICERGEHIAAANERQRDLANDFQAKLQGYGFSTRMFDPAGQDSIGGGCGQLWFVQDWMKQNANLARNSAGTGLPQIHMPSGPLDNS